MQLLVQVPKRMESRFQAPAWMAFWHKGVLRVWKQMGPAVLAQSTTQINLVVNSMLATTLVEGSVTWLKLRKPPDAAAIGRLWSERCDGGIAHAGVPA